MMRRLPISLAELRGAHEDPREPLGYADKPHHSSTTPAVEVVAGDRACIVDAVREGPFGLRRIEGRDGSIRVAYKTMGVPGRVIVEARDVPSLVDADPMRGENE